MTRPVVRRVVAQAATLLMTVLVTALLTLTIATPAGSEPSEGVPGVPRADQSSLSISSYSLGCALVSNGTVRCWGVNWHGQLAQGNEDDIGDDPGESTVAVPLPRPAVSISAGHEHACAILDTGELRCWGANGSGQLGQGNTDDVGDDPGESTVRVDFGPGVTTSEVAVGAYSTCALLSTGVVRCMGSSALGQMAQGNNDDVGGQPAPAPRTVAVPLPRPAVQIAAAYSSYCAVLDTGQLYCWGRGNSGELMQGNNGEVGDDAGEVPVLVKTGGRAVLAIAGGGNNFCAIHSDRRLRCWGASQYGQLGLGRSDAFGDGTGETEVGEVPLPTGRTVTAVTVGDTHVCAVLDTGELRCWGESQGLGQGNTQAVGDQPGESTVTVDVGGPVRAVAAGKGVTCAVTDTGLRCWGSNFFGSLARGNEVDYGTKPGELPRLLPPISLGGLTVGRDTDGDGVRDAVDACPSVAGPLANGCVAPPEAVLKGKKVLLDTVLAKKKASAKCPAKAEVTVKTKSKAGRIKVTKQLKTKTVATGCLVKGKVRLPAKPKKSAKVKVSVSGKKLTTKRLIAVRP